MPESVLRDLPEGLADDGARDVNVVEDGAGVRPVHAAGHGGALRRLLEEELEDVVRAKVDVVEEDDLGGGGELCGFGDEGGEGEIPEVREGSDSVLRAVLWAEGAGG